jgi:hypothetical protein
MIKQEAIVPFGDDTYSIGTVDAIEQFHIFRRLAPLVATMGVEMFKMLSGNVNPSELGKADWMVMAAPMVGELAKMPQDDVNYLIMNTLKVVRKKDGDRWAPLLNPQGQMMYSDIGMFAMLRLIIEVLRHNMSDFFPVGLGEASSSDAAQA